MSVPRPDAPCDRIGIVGLGLIGGSVAYAARRAWPRISIVGVDRGDVVQEALRGGAIDQARGTVADLTDVDLIVFAAPVLEIVAQIQAAARRGLRATLTDVGSTKRRIMDAAASAGLTMFVGGHPMAGSARGGFAEARRDLFEKSPWLLVRGASTAPRAVDRVTQFVRGLGAIPRELDAETHDRAMAYVSHLPQLLSSALMRSAGEAIGETGLAAAGRAFAEMTRLASSPPEMWHDILATNADFVAEALDKFLGALPWTRGEIAGRAEIEVLFDRARAWRDRLEQRS